ncbi:MORC family CW-type zinc finger protein 3 [Thalassophryne amazonica]|uniref:MORC family CW-type zinc finger protein 3 n=1 Tax=Thalassophryne amazonica TaxID=390379 RepID=UPI00147203E2|nr:MORC family CW-type zinc finger protein 3 [Thalassophryne amazonica]
MARLSEHGIRLSSMSPSFLNSNSTSHTWPFSAIAELVDNASDPGVSAKQIWIDVVEEDGQLCLTFTDNGSGMTPKKLHKMLSFGFTEKGSGRASQQAIGVYGNGFKSGSMRLGRDALIFTKNGGCQTVGMLSQTYLANIKAQAVIVPIVPFSQQTKLLVVTEDSEASLAAILKHSIITSLDKIHEHFDSMPFKKGTKILIWNIRRGRDDKPEIDFEKDITDFRMPEIQIEELKKDLKNGGSQKAAQTIVEMHYSLRAYLSILYLKPRTQIILRGKKVLAKLVSKRLSHTEHDVYKPHFSNEKVKVTFGLDLKNKDHYGIMMYYKNRLIKAYEKVGCQMKTSGQRGGVGVIGVIECNFLKPAHNKQDFEYTKEYRLTLGALGLKLNDYWRDVTEKRSREREFQALDKDAKEQKEEDDKSPVWLQCEECLKWRTVPAGYYAAIPENWTCSQNPRARFRNCCSPEEEEGEELLTASYQKPHKKREQTKRRKWEKSMEPSEFHDQVAKHPNISSSTLTPSLPLDPLDHKDTTNQCDLDEIMHAQGQTHTDQLSEHGRDTAMEETSLTAELMLTEENPAEQKTVIKDQRLTTETQTHVESSSNSGGLHTQMVKDKHSSKEISMQMTESEEKDTGKVNYKRESGSIFHCINKRVCSWEEQQVNSSCVSERSGDTMQQTPSSLNWTHSAIPTQTMVVSPLSRIEEPRSKLMAMDSGDRESKVQRLAGLEKDVQKLQKLLGLEKEKLSKGTMTAESTNTEKPPASTSTHEVGCQTSINECQNFVSYGDPVHAVSLQDVEPMSEPLQLNRSANQNSESQNKIRISESEDTRTPLEDLQSIRSNVVVLLTALLPQLDLAGISLETNDVDNILQQIININSLKL